MSQPKPKPTLSEILAPPLIADDAQWLEVNAPDYYTAVAAAVKAGQTPQAIFTFYMQESPHRQAFWLRCKHAAEYLVSLSD